MKPHITPTQAQQTFSMGWVSTLLLTLALHSLPAMADTQTRTSSFEYDAQGLVIKETIEPDSPNDCLTTSYTYDPYGNKTQTSTSACPGANGYTLASANTARTSSTSYDSSGRFPAINTNALGQAETKQYDPRFNEATTSLTGPNGLTTTWVYDEFGRKTKETRADGTYTTWSYLFCSETASGSNCPTSSPSLPKDASAVWGVIERSYDNFARKNAPEKHNYYDGLGRLMRGLTYGFDGAGVAATLVQDTQYNELGQIARKSNLYKLGGSPVWTSYTYDALGRITRQETPDPDAAGGLAVIAWNYSGLNTIVTNPKGQSKVTLKNAQGQVRHVLDHDGSIIKYLYNALGQLTTTISGTVLTTLTYNQRGQKTSMVDQAMGRWQYNYNAFGELVSQTDSLGNTSTVDYDKLGRMVKKTEKDLVSQWSYDVKFDGTACGKSKGKLCEAIADNGYRRTHNYDSLGRPSVTTTALDSTAAPATVSVSYDNITGRVTSKTWPTGYIATYTYTELGYLKKISGGGTANFPQTASYEVLAMDEQGHITQYRQGTKVTTVKNYDPINGRLKGQTATADGQVTGSVLSQTYSYDSLGNLLTRADNSPGVGTQESYSYDNLNRLTLATVLGGAVGPPQVTQVLYDAIGNISYKSDVGRYWYDIDRPTRLTQITLQTSPSASVVLTGTRALSYAFDDYKPGAQTVNGTTLGNGNLWYTVSQDTQNGRSTVRWESYTSFNMPAKIEFGSLQQKTNTAVSVTGERSLSFVYGPEHQRVKQITVGGPNPGTTWYFNGEDSQGLSYEKEVRADGTTENKHYLSAGGMVFALFVSRSGNLNGKPATSTAYFHYDHLGSINAITNELGQVIERLAYDPWGKRRQVNGLSDNLDALYSVNTDRGYTMHEHLDEMGVIHMNGRVYDPLIGRFMSADPFIQEPGNLQSYNRYAYVMNNPLAFNDPSGYWRLHWKTVVQIAVRVVAAVADAYGCSGACSAAVGAYYGYQQGGTKGAIVGGVTAYAGYQIGAAYPVTGAGGAVNWGNLAIATSANAATGCAGSAAMGGSCGNGAAMGAAGTLGSVYGMAGSAIAGCAASSAMGSNCSAESLAVAFVFSAVRIGYDYAKASTDAAKLMACSNSDASVCVYNKWGELLTDGSRGTDPTDPRGGSKSWFDFLTMVAEGSGKHSYSEGSGIGRFVNATSKLHDYMNSVDYSNRGFYISRGAVFDTAFDVYSFSGMLPAAALTTAALATQRPAFYLYAPSVQKKRD